MKTVFYNPSKIEIDFCKIINNLQSEIQQKLENDMIISEVEYCRDDNPCLIYHILDKDGDKHELVVQFIQRIED
jgi:hypothetical protein